MSKGRLFLLVYFMVLWQAGFASGIDIEAYLNQPDTNNDDGFYEQFPYNSYLQTYDVSQPEVLQSHCQLLTSAGKDKDRFLLQLAGAYNEYHLPPTAPLHTLVQACNTAQLWMAFKPSDGSIVYEVMADVVFQHVASLLEQGIAEGTLNKNDSHLRQLVQLMVTQQYYIDIPKSNWEKFQQHAADGNWAYIWDRVQKRYML